MNKAIDNNGYPCLINIDKSGSNKAAIWTVNKRSCRKGKIKVRQVKYLNNIVEQGHRHIRKKTQWSLRFKEFESAQRTIAGMVQSGVKS